MTRWRSIWEREISQKKGPRKMKSFHWKTCVRERKFLHSSYFCPRRFADHNSTVASCHSRKFSNQSNCVAKKVSFMLTFSQWGVGWGVRWKFSQKTTFSAWKGDEIFFGFSENEKLLLLLLMMHSFVNVI